MAFAETTYLKPFAVVLVTAAILLYGLFMYFPNTDRKSPKIVMPVILKVLVWSPFFGDYNYIPRNLSGLGCQHDTCIFTSNRSTLATSDAVLLHWRDIDRGGLPPKDTNATIILYNYEAPPHVSWKELQPVVTRINYVATYRFDSDVTCPYGFVRRRTTSDPDPLDITLEDFNSKKGIVGAISHCGTSGKREDLVKKLKQHIPLEIFGLCGTESKCKGISYQKCYELLSKSYKFFLSFENSFCLDYATEKVFLPLLHGMVPVVYGGANYSRILPPNSFVNTLDFKTPKDLVDYLRVVNNSFPLYQSYHKWRKKYFVVHAFPDFYWLCDLCRVLQTKKSNRIKTKTKNGFHKWWFDDAKCRQYSEIFQK